jgi:hypothetical protein
VVNFSLKYFPVLKIRLYTDSGLPCTGVHHIRAQAVRSKLDIRRFSFSQRVISTCNLPPDSLKGVGTTLAFKIGYDKWVSKIAIRRFSQCH